MTSHSTTVVGSAVQPLTLRKLRRAQGLCSSALAPLSLLGPAMENARADRQRFHPGDRFVRDVGELILSGLFYIKAMPLVLDLSFLISRAVAYLG